MLFIAKNAPTLFKGALRMGRVFTYAQLDLYGRAMEYSTEEFGQIDDKMGEAYQQARKVLIARFPSARKGFLTGTA